MANLLDMLAGAAAPDEYRQMMGPATLGPLVYLISRLSGTNDVLEQSMRGYLGAKPSYSVMDERAPLLRNAYRGAEVAGIVDDALPGMMVAGEAAGKGARAMQEAHELAARRGPGEGGLLDMMMPRRVPGEAYAIDVWHGSPHKFDRFDSSRIGTGEGAQAYGYGGYFGEAKGTGESYRAALSRGFGLPDGPTKGIAHLIAARGEEGERLAREAYKELGEKLEPAIDAAKKAVHENSYLYKARLAWPDAAREASDPLGPQHFLDWHKPMSQQRPEIVKAWKETKKLMPENARVDLGGDWSLLYGKDVMPDEFLATAESIGGRPGFGESLLAKFGVPGNTYFDAGSRAAGQGTRNYVTFDDNLIKLLERNGEPLR